MGAFLEMNTRIIMKATKLHTQIFKIARKKIHTMMESTVLCAQISHPTSIYATRDAKCALKEVNTAVKDHNAYQHLEAQFKMTLTHRRCMQTCSIRQLLWFDLKKDDAKLIKH